MKYEIDGVEFELKGSFDFGFLREYGKVFRVFDKQDSGNLCFGVNNGAQKLFLKIAGAETMRANIIPPKAVERLRTTSEVYDALKHPYLLKLIGHEDIPGGYLHVFEWFDGLCMGRQYGHTMRFLDLPVDEKLKIYSCILDFHSHVNRCGYVAIDFYDGSIMYDFETRQTRICDIEFYSKMPYVNPVGRMWGSGRYMSPEEFELGAVIDRRTNVFNMGATAFQLFGGGVERERSKWQLSEKRYRAAIRAVNHDPLQRFENIEEFVREWQ